MGNFWRGIWGLFATIVAGLILYTFQDTFKEHFVGQPVVAEAYVGAWAPYPRDGRPIEEGPGLGTINSAANQASRIGDDFPFAMISIRNRHYKPIENVTVDLRTSWKNDFMIVDTNPENPTDTRVVLDNTEFKIPKIEPNREFRVFMWSPVGVENSYLWSDIRAFSNEGRFQIRVKAYEEVDSVYADPWWMRLIESFGSFALLILMMILLITLVAALHYFESYIKKLFRNDDFYLVERIRFEKDGSKFVADLKDVTKDK